MCVSVHACTCVHVYVYNEKGSRVGGSVWAMHVMAHVWTSEDGL